MGNYTLAWLLVIAMGVGGGVVVWLLLRAVKSLSLKLAVVAAVVLLFIVPAPVPGYDGDFAPAFVVGTFEAFFQIEGRPGTAFVNLGIAVVSGLIIGFLAGRLIGRRSTSA